MKNVTVLGGGSFGTALAQLLARHGHAVLQWMRDPRQAAAVQTSHRNPQYLSEFDLHPQLAATSNLEQAISHGDWLVSGLPSQAFRATLQAAKAWLTPRPFVVGTKGIEHDSLMTMDEVAIEILGPSWTQQIIALSGPSFAREIMMEHPTAVVLACPDEPLAQRMARHFFSDNFRAYTTCDMVGVEMGGAIKNVMAIAAGAISGLGLGDNTRAAMITRGASEITRLAVAKGGKPLTLLGLAGVGDLVLTCTGGLSRNRAVGQALGEGKSVQEAIATVRQVAEGVYTTAAAHRLAQQLSVDAPIVRAVYRVLYEDLPARDAMLELVRRAPGREIE